MPDPTPAQVIAQIESVIDTALWVGLKPVQIEAVVNAKLLKVQYR